MTDTLRAQLLAAYADEHRDHLAALREAFGGSGAPELEEAYRRAHSLKGAARAVDLPLAETLAHGLETVLQALWDGRVALDGGLRRVALRALDAIEDVSAAALADRTVPRHHPALDDLNGALAGMGLETVEPPEGAAAPPFPATGGPMLRVDAATADRLRATTERLLAELDGQRGITPELWALGEGLGALRRHCVARLGRTGLGELAEVGARLDALISHHEEAMRKLADREWALSGLGSALGDEVARLRLVSAEGVLGGFGPMVREMAARQGKEVDFVMSGLSTMADRDVLQALGEAVLHLLRNAVTHGVEDPAERRAAGKDPVASLALSLRGGGGRVVVTVSDDGRGIDPRAVGRAAARRGLIEDAEAEHGDPDRLRALLFEPGFSTSGEVTPFAGRGMGLAIIRRVATRLQGTVDLESERGKGTAIRMVVPVTVLAQRIVLVVVRGRTFGLPAAALVRLDALTADDLVVAGDRTLARIDGGEMALADLGQLLGLPGEPAHGRTVCVAVMRLGAARMGLVADRFVDVRDLPVAALDPPLADDPRLGGVVTLEDGRLALVLSPAGLFPLGQQAGPVVRSAEASPPPLVLVVDDSITTRMLERSILEAHGYRVELAVDGRDALRRMAERPPDLVLSDVEMPNMDGFALLAEIKGHADWKAIPVVLVTSRDSPEDRARGIRLGADAYIVKTRFDPQDLLETIARLAWPPEAGSGC